MLTDEKLELVDGRRLATAPNTAVMFYELKLAPTKTPL